METVGKLYVNSTVGTSFLSHFVFILRRTNKEEEDDDEKVACYIHWFDLIVLLFVVYCYIISMSISNMKPMVVEIFS